MSPKTKRALQILQKYSPAGCSTFGAKMWPNRETTGVPPRGGGDYPAQMYLGRLKRQGLVQWADGEGSTLWELSGKGMRALEREVDEDV